MYWLVMVMAVTGILDDEEGIASVDFLMAQVSPEDSSSSRIALRVCILPFGLISPVMLSASWLSR